MTLLPNREIKVNPEELVAFCVEILRSVGVSREDARIVSDCLFLASLRGVDSHGVIRLPSYVKAIRNRQIDTAGTIKVVRENANVAVVDGGMRLGPVVALTATRLAIEKAKATGIGVACARHLSHIGMLAYYGLQILRNGMVGIAMTSASPNMAPWGGAQKLLGTNPICFAFPVDSKREIVLDMATTVTSYHRLKIAAMKGEKVPDGWAVDKKGKPTNDPREGMEGFLLPVGGYKGYGLALSIEILSSLLSGSAYSNLIKSTAAPQGGFFVQAMDISVFRRTEEFWSDARDLVNRIEHCPILEGTKEILLPGEQEAREQQRRSQDGIPIDQETWSDFEALSRELSVRLPTLLAVQP